jgi:hypothetical protein
MRTPRHISPSSSYSSFCSIEKGITVNARRLTLTTLVTCCVLIGGLLFAGAPALAELTHFYTGHSFGPEGLGASRFPGEVTPASVAVEQSTGDVYAVASGGGIYKFNASGEPVDFSALGTNEITSGLEVEAPYVQLAVSSAGPTAGDLYVASLFNSSVKIFGPEGSPIGELNRASVHEPCGVAVDPAGDVYVATYTGEVDKYTPVANPATSSDYTASLWGAGEICNIAADSEGNVYAAALGGGPVTKYEASQFNTLEIPAIGMQITESSGGSLAVDPAPSHDDLYVDHRGSVAQYDSTGTLLGTSASAGPGALNDSVGLAVSDATGELYADDSGVVEIFGPALAAAEVTTGAVSSPQPTGVTLEGIVNPGNVPVSTCEFEYGAETTYGKSIACAQTVPFSGAAAVPVTADLTGLQANTTYHYRLLATDAHGTNYGADATFTTPGPARIENESSNGITQTGATLQAQADPDGYATTYHFEYGETPAYGTSTPIPDGTLGSAEEPTAAPASELTGLKVGTTYHYRLVTTSSQGTVDGPDQEFTTVAAALIENEQVNDVAATSATLQAEIYPLGNVTHYYFQYGPSNCSANPSSCVEMPLAPGSTIAAAAESVVVSIHPQSLTANTTYHFRVVTENVLGVSDGPDRTFKTQPAGGELVLPDGREWELVSPPNKNGATIQTPGGFYEIGLPIQASEDGDAIAYAANAPAGENPSANEAPSVTSILSSRGVSGGWVSQDIATPMTTPSGVTEGVGEEYRLFSPDLSLALVEPRTATPLSAEAAGRTLYLRDDTTGGYTPLITAANVSPGTGLGGPGNYEAAPHVEGASPDLKHVVFRSVRALTANAVERKSPFNSPLQNVYEWTGGQLQLVSVLPNHKAAITEPVGEYPVLGSNLYPNQITSHAVSADGSRVIWSAEGSEGVNLYLRDTVRQETVRLNSAQGTPEPIEEAKAVYLTANSSGSRVFFVDTQKLTSAAGNDDLYVFEVTSGSDEPVAGRLTDLGGAAGSTAAIASEDGSSVYYGGEVWHNDGAGWAPTAAGVNTGDVDGRARLSPDGRYLAFIGPEEGVSLYDAQTNRVVCASCNPDGEHGTGGTIPPWSRDDGLGKNNYQSRYLSDSGRLFFETADALVPQDTNGKSDVYEYEPEGVGSCESSSVTFNEKSGGCVGLISSGTSSEPSTFLDASENGDDVFFLTTQRLDPQDYDKAVDVYDAHVCSAAVPCTTAAVSPPACTTADSCRTAAPPQPTIFGAPPSATFSGAGNLTRTSAPPKSVATPKSLTRAQKLAKALKVCERGPKRKRQACESAARKKYKTKSVRTKKPAKRAEKGRQ